MMATQRHGKTRRGILLLIILALLAMFGVVAVTFVIIASNQRRSAEALQWTDKEADRPEKLLHEAALQVLRDTKRTNSALRTHSLLEDMYGSITTGEIPQNATAAGTNVEFLMPQAHLRAGCWLTLLSHNGITVRQSRQITGYRVQTTGSTYQVYARMPAFVSPGGGNPPEPEAGDRYVVYDAPWRGRLHANANLASINSGQMLQFSAHSPPPLNTGLAPASIPVAELHRFVGCTLTMLDGPVAGQSTRIVGYTQDYGAGGVPLDSGRLRVMAFKVPTPTLVSYVQNNTCDYIINPPPFSGTGFGFNPTVTAVGTPKLDVQDPGEDYDGDGALDPGEDLDGSGNLTVLPFPEYALAPNHAQIAPNIPNGYVDPAGPGGANEDYDAVDYQNMLLAGNIPVDTDSDGTPDAYTFIPSLHRPELVRYWLQLLAQNPTQFGLQAWPMAWTELEIWRAILQPVPYAPAGAVRDGILAFKRRILLRPLNDDHTAFNGSNTESRRDISNLGGFADAAALRNYAFWESNGPWDVDNDNDGVPDSIWVDLGMPVRALRDGRLYRPLFAILCMDLDGRLNLNAHGSTVELAAGFGGATSGPFAGSNSITVRRGQGYGPADVRLTEVLTANDVARLLRGDSATSGFEGRYGESAGGSAEAYATGFASKLNQFKFSGYPADYSKSATAGLTAFGNPPDLWGRTVVGVDYRGQPFFGSLSWANETLNHPYDFNLFSSVSAAPPGTQVDNRIALTELERLLRAFDVDSQMRASRLPALLSDFSTNTLVTNPDARQWLTTDSWDLPSPSNTLVPPALANLLPGASARTINDLLRAKIIDQGLTPPLTLAQEEELKARMSQILSWDLLSNLRMDINRPFGNGRDDNANGTVDEPQESASETGWDGATLRLGNGALFYRRDCIVDIDGDSDTDDDDQRVAGRVYARQLYARHLFTLAMLLHDDGYFQPTTTGTQDATLSNADKRELTVRRIAQWAINVVDFRDADAIMTPFEYVLNPFDANGWNVDGNVSTNETTMAAPHNNPNRRVVWGCEAPDVLLTESAAFHDRRLADTAFDTAPQKKRFEKDGTGTWVVGDSDLDQTRIPQGSAFFELYATRNVNNPVAPPELYTYNSTTKKWYLDLGRLAPAGSNGLKYPVWRMVISRSCEDNANGDLYSRFGIRAGSLANSRPDSASPETEQYSGATLPPGDFNLLATTPMPLDDPAQPATIEIDRIVWFTTQPPQHIPAGVSHYDWDRIYYNRQYDPDNSPPLARYLEPGKYMIVGPRVTTNIGSTSTLGTPSQRRIEFLHNSTMTIPDPITGKRTGVTITNASGGSNYLIFDPANPDPQIQMPDWMIVGGEQPAGWTANSPAAPTGIGISISEPLFSGNYYQEPTLENDENKLIEAYGDLKLTDNTKRFPHGPLDSVTGRPLYDDNASGGSHPLLETGTTEGYKIVLLQRLANPLAAFDPVSNPYRTVDWSPIDLTVFNGEDRPNYPAEAGVIALLPQWDSDDPGARSSKNIQFGARQRGGTNNNLWKQTWANLPGAVLAYGSDTGTEIFQQELDDATGAIQSLGYLNQPFGTPWRKSQVTNPSYANQYYGDPATPFPWLAWNDRPFVSPTELLLVPTSQPGRLFQEFTLVQQSGGADINPYDDAGDPANPGATPFAHPFGFGYPYGHLANFFHHSGTTDNSPHLYRIFEYLRVPSRFVGTEQPLDPVRFSDESNANTALFRPPFNMVSQYREPGRINLNTVFSEEVWQALLGKGAGPTPGFPDLVRSRQLFLYNQNANYPTWFGNPFRSPGSADYVPSLRGAPPYPLARQPINVSVLRTRIDTVGSATQSPDVAADASQSLFFEAATTDNYNHTDRNPYFRYQELERISNLVTTRSNVYAVWITVGFFEVERVPVATLNSTPNANSVYPDGYRFRGELGSDTGEVKRHRAFYMIDRSIPVGFRRGEDLNSGNCVQLKRLIE